MIKQMMTLDSPRSTAQANLATKQAGTLTADFQGLSLTAFMIMDPTENEAPSPEAPFNPPEKHA